MYIRRGSAGLKSKQKFQKVTCMGETSPFPTASKVQLKPVIPVSGPTIYFSINAINDKKTPRFLIFL